MTILVVLLTGMKATNHLTVVSAIICSILCIFSGKCVSYDD